MGLWIRKLSPFESESGEADAIRNRSLKESRGQLDTELDEIDTRYPGDVVFHPGHPRYNPQLGHESWMSERNEAYGRARDRAREINEAHGQTIGTLQMKHFPDAVRSGRVWSPDPALDNFGNRNLNPMQFGG